MKCAYIIIIIIIRAPNYGGVNYSRLWSGFGHAVKRTRNRARNTGSVERYADYNDLSFKHISARQVALDELRFSYAVVPNEGL